MAERPFGLQHILLRVAYRRRIWCTSRGSQVDCNATANAPLFTRSPHSEIVHDNRRTRYVPEGTYNYQVLFDEPGAEQETLYTSRE